MADKKKKHIRMTTPVGTAKFPWLTKPDTRFKAEGVFCTGLLVPKEDAEELCQELDRLADEAFKAAIADLKAKKKNPKVIEKTAKHEPYQMEVDSEGNETGMVEFRFKTNAQANINGEVRKFVVPLFDSVGNPVKCSPWGGSQIRVNFSPIPFYNAVGNGLAGVSLRLNAVQVIKLVSGSGDAKSYGFDAVDGGFEGNDDADTDTDSNGTGDDSGDDATSDKDFDY
jgi:hypothetical protein